MPAYRFGISMRFGSHGEFQNDITSLNSDQGFSVIREISQHGARDFLKWRWSFPTDEMNASFGISALQRRHNGHDGVSNHQPHDCLLSRSFRRRSKKTLKLRVTGLCEGNSPVNGEFPTQRASYAESVSSWWLHHLWHMNASVSVVEQTQIKIVLRKLM